MLQQGNKVGLGTDVAGGYHPSMLNAARMTVVASQACQEHSSNSRPLDYRHAIYLATLGGAQSLGMQGKIGTLQVGMELDAIVLSAKVRNSIVSIFPGQDTLADVFQKLWVLGDDRNIRHVYVQGKEVKHGMQT